MPAIVPFTELVRRAVAQYSVLVWLAVMLLAVGYLSYRLLAVRLPRQLRAIEEEDPANYPQPRSDGRPATVYLFHVDWCSFCTKALPEWRRFVQAFDGRRVHGFRVTCLDINVTDPQNKEKGVDGALAQQYQLKSFPTVKLVLEGKKVITLNGAPTYDALRSFLDDCTRAAE